MRIHTYVSKSQTLLMNESKAIQIRINREWKCGIDMLKIIKEV